MLKAVVSGVRHILVRWELTVQHAFLRSATASAKPTLWSRQEVPMLSWWSQSCQHVTHPARSVCGERIPANWWFCIIEQLLSRLLRYRAFGPWMMNHHVPRVSHCTVPSMFLTTQLSVSWPRFSRVWGSVPFFIVSIIFNLITFRPLVLSRVFPHCSSGEAGQWGSRRLASLFLH